MHNLVLVAMTHNVEFNKPVMIIKQLQTMNRFFLFIKYELLTNKQNKQ